MKKGIIILVAISISVFLLIGCSDFINQRKGIEKCEFELQSAKLGNLTITGVNLKLKIKITNPNNSKVIVERLDYEVFANSKFIARGSNNDKFEIKPNSDYILGTTVFLGYANLGDFIKELVKQNEVKYLVKGTVYIDTPVGTIKYPIKITKIEK